MTHSIPNTCVRISESYREILGITGLPTENLSWNPQGFALSKITMYVSGKQNPLKQEGIQ